jgi:cytochrome c oxidase subunit 3
MLIFLGSWAMMFAALFFSYGFVRAKSVTWPPPGIPPLPVLLPALNTLILLLSSFTFARGLKELRRGRKRSFPWAVLATFALGALFLGLQFQVWISLWNAGLQTTSGLFGSVFYGLTTIHALHVAVGLLILGWVFVRSLQGRYSEHNHINIRLCTMFWHFVDGVWVLMFISLYLL